jgi:hypothetical protein
MCIQFFRCSLVSTFIYESQISSSVTHTICLRIPSSSL